MPRICWLKCAKKLLSFETKKPPRLSILKKRVSALIQTSDSSAYRDTYLHCNSLWDCQNLCADTLDLRGVAMSSRNLLIQPIGSIPLDFIATASAEVDPKAQTLAKLGYLELIWSSSCQTILQWYFEEHHQKVCYIAPISWLVTNQKIDQRWFPWIRDNQTFRGQENRRKGAQVSRRTHICITRGLIIGIRCDSLNVNQTF